jgi:hypothetical protein
MPLARIIATSKDAVSASLPEASSSVWRGPFMAPK